jgi:hypothetical protein
MQDIAKMPVVEKPGIVSGLHEGFGIYVGAYFLDTSEAVGKNKARDLIHTRGFENKPTPLNSSEVN